MNYLQLAQRLHAEIGGGPGDPGTQPTTVVAQSGKLKRYCDWTQQAYVDLQLSQPWRWMRKTGTFATSASVREYAPVPSTQVFTDFNTFAQSGSVATASRATAHGIETGYYVTFSGSQGPTGYLGTFLVTAPTTTTLTYTTDPSAADAPIVVAGSVTTTWNDCEKLLPCSDGCDAYILAYLTAAGVTDQQPVYYVPYTEFGGFYDRGNFTTTGRPQYYTIMPGGNIAFFPIPNASYTVTIPYKRTPQHLITDFQQPNMPPHFHMLIVWYALAFYGTSNEANRATAQSEFFKRPLWVQLCNDQLDSPL